MPQGATLRSLPGSQNFKITSTIVFDHLFQVNIQGNDSLWGYGDVGTHPTFWWYGAAGGTMVRLNNVYASTFRGFGFHSGNPETSAAASIGLEVTFTLGGNPSISSQDVITCNSFNNSYGNRTDWKAIKIGSPNGANSEWMEVSKNLLFGSDSRRGVGVYLEHINVKDIDISDNVALALDVFVESVGAKFTSYRNMGGSCRVLYKVNTHEPITIVGDGMEGVKTVLEVPAGNAVYASFKGCRYLDIDTAAHLEDANQAASAGVVFERLHGFFFDAASGGYRIKPPNPGINQLTRVKYLLNNQNVGMDMQVRIMLLRWLFGDSTATP